MIYQLTTTDGATAIQHAAIAAISHSKADVLKGEPYFRVHLNSGKYFCSYFEGNDACDLLRFWLPDLAAEKFGREAENG